eukprot:5767497-Lingulodinium_polyedra.AAC.1
MARALREPPMLPGFRRPPLRSPRMIGTVPVAEPSNAMVEASAAAAQSSADALGAASAAAGDARGAR